MRALHNGVERHFLTTDDREDSTAGPSQRTYLRSQVHKQLNAERSRWLVTLGRKSKEVSPP